MFNSNTRGLYPVHPYGVYEDRSLESLLSLLYENLILPSID